MKLGAFIKKHSGNILIILGLLLISVTVFQVVKLRYFENRLALPADGDTNSSGYEELPAVGNETNKENSQTEVPAQSKPAGENIWNGNFIIYLPKIKVRAEVVKGTTTSLLKKGPGLYEKSPLPSENGGNVCIAGHRTTYGAWFRNVDKLKAGDDIILEFQGLNYNYKVEKVFIVASNDWSVTKPVGYSALTLTSCHPLHSSRQRIVVRAKLENVEKK